MCVTRGTIISSLGEKIGPLWQERLQYEKGKYCRSRLFQENPDGQFALSAGRAKGRAFDRPFYREKKVFSGKVASNKAHICQIMNTVPLGE